MVMNRRVVLLSIIFTFLLLAGVTGNILPVESQTNPGDILVIDYDAGTGGLGALFLVNPTTGARTLLSDFGVGPNQGVDPFGVAVEASGNILVIDAGAGTGGYGALFRVDPISGERTLLSDFGVGPNQGVDPGGVAVEPSGTILVIDQNAGTSSLGALFRVDPISGERTLLSDFGVGPNQGFNPVGVAVEASGNILVIDRDAGTGFQGALFKVNPVTGERRVISDFGVGGNQGDLPYGVAVEASGTILVIDAGAGTGGYGALFRVDPISGERTLLSDFGVGPNQGLNPIDIAVEASGNILVIDAAASILFRVNPTTGARALLSDFGAGANQGVVQVGVAVYPVISAAVGGVASPVNKFEIITPYLVLVGLIAVVSTVYIVKKRKD
jgi:streptogramin lyase